MTDTTGPSQAAVDGLLSALADVIKNTTSPDVQAAQALLLRRLAVEGDVIPSRLHAPRNITEMGGYLNLVTQLGRDNLRTQMLTAVLGVAGRSPLAGREMPAPPLALVPVANDRPPGANGSTVTAAVLVRTDLADGLRSALQSIHTAGGMLPLWSPPPALPPASPGVVGAVVPDPLLYLGRALWIAPSAALIDPRPIPWWSAGPPPTPAPATGWPCESTAAHLAHPPPTGRRCSGIKGAGPWWTVTSAPLSYCRWTRCWPPPGTHHLRRSTDRRVLLTTPGPDLSTPPVSCPASPAFMTSFPWCTRLPPSPAVCSRRWRFIWDGTAFSPTV